jgi:hypothetical protein
MDSDVVRRGPESGSETDERWGMTSGSHLAASAGKGERRRAGGGCWVGWAELRCWAAVGEKVERAGGVRRIGTGPGRKRGGIRLRLAGLQSRNRPERGDGQGKR